MSLRRQMVRLRRIRQIGADLKNLGFFWRHVGFCQWLAGQSRTLIPTTDSYVTETMGHLENLIFTPTRPPQRFGCEKIEVV